MWERSFSNISRSGAVLVDGMVSILASDQLPRLQMRESFSLIRMVSPKILDYEGKELKRWDYVINALTQVSGIDGGKRIVLASRKDHRF